MLKNCILKKSQNVCLLKAYKEGKGLETVNFLFYSFRLKWSMKIKVMGIIRWNSSAPSVVKQLNGVVLFYLETASEERIIISILDEGIESQRLGSVPKVILPVSGGAGIPFQLLLSKEATLLLIPVHGRTAS